MAGGNVGASVYARLKNLSKERGVDMTALLRRYAQERLLYRLSVSPEAENFCVKGGLLLSAYNGGDLLRPTEDIDFNGFDAAADVAVVEKALRRILEVQVEPDGVVFFPETMKVQKDRTGRIPGGKVALMSTVHTAKVEIRVDVGFGNPVTPGVRKMAMPTLLDNVAPRPEVLAYPLETVIAEKIHAMAQFGIANTRVKDYYDIWMLMKTHHFSGSDLAEAVMNTFEAQGREISVCLEGLTEDYAEEQEDTWRAFLRRIDHKEFVGLEAVVTDISGFIKPVLVSAAEGEDILMDWQPDTGWASPGIIMK